MSKPPAPRPGDLVGRNYTLERALGEGGMGRVYLARHAVTGRRVALKWVQADDPVLRERVLREARSMGRLSHPNVVGVLDAGEHRNAVFIVMEYVEGSDLRAYARKHPEQSVGAKLDLILPAMSGVAAAHQAGILHRDLKPENLFVCTDVDGSAFDTKVLDFGVAKSVGDSEAALTSTGAIVGTPKYMAPEQITHGDEVDARMDVYALGLMLYELLAGKLPYVASSLKTMVVEILAGQITPLGQLAPALPPALCDAVMKALANDREDRWADVASFARALQPFAERQVFEPPRGVHTPETALADVTSPEFERASAEHQQRSSQRAPAAAPTVTKPRRRASAQAEAPTLRDPGGGGSAVPAMRAPSTQRSVGQRGEQVASARIGSAASVASAAPRVASTPWWLVVAAAALALALSWVALQRWASSQVAANAPGGADATGEPPIAPAPAPVLAAAPASAPASTLAPAPTRAPMLAAAPAPASAATPTPADARAPLASASAAGSPSSPAASSAPTDAAPHAVRTRHERRGAPSEAAAATEPTVKTRGGVLRAGDF